MGEYFEDKSKLKIYLYSFLIVVYSRITQSIAHSFENVKM